MAIGRRFSSLSCLEGEDAEREQPHGEQLADGVFVESRQVDRERRGRWRRDRLVRARRWRRQAAPSRLANREQAAMLQVSRGEPAGGAERARPPAGQGRGCVDACGVERQVDRLRCSGDRPHGSGEQQRRIALGRGLHKPSQHRHTAAEESHHVDARERSGDQQGGRKHIPARSGCRRQQEAGADGNGQAAGIFHTACGERLPIGGPGSGLAAAGGLIAGDDADHAPAVEQVGAASSRSEVEEASSSIGIGRANIEEQPGAAPPLTP